MLLHHAAWIVYGRRSASQGVGFIGRSHRLRVCGEPATGSGTPVSGLLAAISSLLPLLVSQLWLRAGWRTSHAVGTYTTLDRHTTQAASRCEDRCVPGFGHGAPLGGSRYWTLWIRGIPAPGFRASLAAGCLDRLWPLLGLARSRIHWTVTEAPCALRAGNWEKGGYPKA